MFAFQTKHRGKCQAFDSIGRDIKALGNRDKRAPQIVQRKHDTRLYRDVFYLFAGFIEIAFHAFLRKYEWTTLSRFCMAPLEQGVEEIAQGQDVWLAILGIGNSECFGFEIDLFP